MKLKSKIYIFLVLMVFLFAIGSVCAEDNQTDIVMANEDTHSIEELNKKISNASSELNLECDYSGDGEVEINKNFTLNGNGHEISSSNKGVSFNFLECKAVSINNLTFKDKINILTSSSDIAITFNNVNFINDCEFKMIIAADIQKALFNNCTFKSNHGAIYISSQNGNVILKDCRFTGSAFCEEGAVRVNRGGLLVEDTTFIGLNSRIGTAINYKGNNITLKRSKFINLHASGSGGAIIGKFFTNGANHDVVIEDCVFTNTSASQDGGAIYYDLDGGSDGLKLNFNITNTNFTDCKSRYGGAIAILGGVVNIVGSEFEDNYASFEGGAIYSSWSELNLINSKILNNTAALRAGGIYFDYGKFVINGSELKNNKVESALNNGASAIYANDADAKFTNVTFNNTGLSVYMNFNKDSNLINITKNDDIFLLNNTDYIVSVETPGIKLKLVKDKLVFDALPSKFDLRDYGWMTPAKIQNDNNDCWAFANVAALESSLLKATGVAYNLSANYAQKLLLKYRPIGDMRINDTGFDYSVLGYALSWYGALLMDDAYDDRGLISDTDLNVSRIHVQDAMFIPGNSSDFVRLAKEAIIKYGPVTIHFTGYYTPGEHQIVHYVSLIGWDDNLVSSDGNHVGMWFIKDSLTGFGKLEYDYNYTFVRYMEDIVPQAAGIVYIFENNINYHVNYQTDLTGLTGFDGNYKFYSNEYTSEYDELIGAVGTYFNESGIKYSFDVYINGNLTHSQSGVSEFAGFKTIKLNKYLPIKAGDKFKVVFKGNVVPYQAFSRQHYIPNVSFASSDNATWIDFEPLNKTVCLKVYTLLNEFRVTEIEDIAVEYYTDSYFTVKIEDYLGNASGGDDVQFTIGGKTYNVKTDANGIAKLKIIQAPGTYKITTTYNGTDYENEVTVVDNSKIINNKNIKVDYTGGKYFPVKVVTSNGQSVGAGAVVNFIINGKTYSVRTDANGIAKLKITQVPKEYAIITRYNGQSYKNTITVKHVITAKKVTVKKTAKRFTIKAKLKINGKLIKGKVIKFKFKGKTYKAKTNKKGIAKVTIKKKVIKKLKKGKKYAVKVSYLKDTIKTTVKVK